MHNSQQDPVSIALSDYFDKEDEAENNFFLNIETTRDNIIHYARDLIEGFTTIEEAAYAFKQWFIEWDECTGEPVFDVEFVSAAQLIMYSNNSQQGIKTTNLKTIRAIVEAALDFACEKYDTSLSIVTNDRYTLRNMINDTLMLGDK